ncbi:MAG: hypothetical protein H6745_04005 [Deltaproteobacteria bacterium]|nr:hypothetical protein [Deltaproteobacteria bacterium]
MLTLIFAALLLPGCLDANRAGSSGDVSGGDTTGADTVTGDTGGGDTTPSCVGVTCDDGDPCTVDFCDPSTGLCRHDGTAPAADAARPAPECLDNSDCDDGDACTTDLCVPWDACYPTGGGACEHQAIAGCSSSCALTPCSDGKRCTEDVCRADGTCEFRPLYGCVEMCSGAGANVVADAPFLTEDAALKFGGVIREDANQACNDGPYCDCVAGAVVEDATGRLPIAPSGAGGTWGCGSTGCATPEWMCTPVEHERAYWLTGKVSQRVFFADVPAGEAPGAAPAPPPEVELSVGDYCLQTTPAGLAGLYRGVFESLGDAAPRYAELTIARTNPLTLTLVVACPGCSAIPSEPWLIGNLRVTDGRLDFTARAPASGGEALDVVLFPGRQNLDGSYRPAGAMEVTGLVKLTLANDQVIPF